MGLLGVLTLMTRKNMHARSFFFKDLATPIGFIRAYMLIEFSKLQNIYILKNIEKGSLTQQLLLDSI